MSGNGMCEACGKYKEVYGPRWCAACYPAHSRPAGGRRRIYISGPMTGRPDLNFPAFHAEAKRLRAAGHEVVNPAEINPDSSLSWEECMRADIRALCDCDTLALLDGWEQSKGAHLELHLAHRLGLRIVILANDISLA